MTDSKPTAQPKKPYPSFWKTLKHPSPNTSALPLPNPSLESLTDQQKSTYEFIVNSLSSPDFELPVTVLANSSRPIKEGPRENPVSPFSITLSEAEKCFCSREAILRACRASQWDQHRALKRLVDTLVWRREFGVDQIDHSQLSHEAETGKQFTLGYDNNQRPILYMFPYRQNTKPSIDQIKLLVWYLERTIDLMPPGVETLTLIIDFGTSEQNRKSTSQPTPISIAKQVLKILQTYYCERLGQAICINVPWVFWGFLQLLKPFMDPKTMEKVLFNPVVTDHVPAVQLLKGGFKGALDFEYDHEVYYNLFAELTVHRKNRMLARYGRYGKGMIGVSEFELRGGNRTVKSRREQSIGTSSTVISSQTEGSTASSALGTQPASAIEDGPSQGSSGAEFQHELDSNSQLDPLNHRISDTCTIDSKGRGSSKHSKDLTLASIVEKIASRPLSLNSFSPPMLSPRELDKGLDTSRAAKSGSIFLFHSKSIKKNRATADPNWPSPPVCHSPYVIHASRNSFISTSLPSSTNSKRQTINHTHQYRTSNAFSPDQHGRLLQPDDMSCSRRISRICS